MDNNQIIITYEAILNTTNKMLVAAKDSEWEELIKLEKACRTLAQKLVQDEEEPVLSTEEQQRKIDLIRQILADDAEIRTITEPWMSKLQEMIGTTNRARNLNKTYQSN